MELVFGAGLHDRVVDQVEDRLAAYRKDVGISYLDYKPSTPSDHLYPEDLAVTILISSRVGPAAFKSVEAPGASLKFADLPHVTLEDSSDEQRGLVADFITPIPVRHSWPMSELECGSMDRRSAPEPASTSLAIRQTPSSGLRMSWLHKMPS